MLQDTQPVEPQKFRLLLAHRGDDSETDTAELIAYVCELQAQVLAWLREKHPELAPRR